MTNRELFKPENRIISWDTETLAVESAITVACIACNQSLSYSIINDGLGSSDKPFNEEANAHIRELEEYYHASGYEIPIVCDENHTQNLLIIFGETQPARYVLVHAGLLMSQQG